MPIEINDNGEVVTQTQGEILTEVNDTFVNGNDDGIEGFGSDFQLTDADFTYRQNAIFAQREALLQSAVAGSISALNLDNATGRGLDIIGTLLENKRQPATRSKINVLLRGTPGIDVGDKRVQYRLTEDFWRTPAGAVIGDNGTLATTLTADSTGPLFAAANASTEWVIVDVVTGWVSVESTADAQRGTDRELDPAYRARLQNDNSGGDATQPAVKKEVRETQGVISASFKFNDSPVASEGVPAWHLEAVVNGGSDLDVATTIYNVKVGTTPTFGNTTVNVTDPSDGEVVPINFSRIVNKQVKASLVLQRSTDTELPLDAEQLAIAAVANRINTNGAGIDVDPGDLLSVAALALPPGSVLPDGALSTCTVAFKGGAGQTTPLTITRREEAFTVARDQAAKVTGTAQPTYNLTAGEALALSINAGALFTLVVNLIDFADLSAATMTEIVAAFGAQAPEGLIVGTESGALVLSTVATGPDSSIAVGPTSSASLLAELGLVVGTESGAGSDIAVSFVGPI